MALLDDAKLALRITTNAYDSQLTNLIAAAKLDLGVAGVTLPSTLDELCNQAIITYCSFKFGQPEDYAYKRLKASYDEQKAQLSMATGYTTWTSQT